MYVCRFIIQLKQALKNGCLGYQAYIIIIKVSFYVQVLLQLQPWGVSVTEAWQQRARSDSHVSEKSQSRASVAASSGFGSEFSQQTPPGMGRQISPGMPRMQGTNSRLTTVSMR